jgi:hypothetical protein
VRVLRSSIGARCSPDREDTSCILAWLIEQGYEVYAFMADVGQEEVRQSGFKDGEFRIEQIFLGLCCRGEKGSQGRSQEIFLGSEESLRVWETRYLTMRFPGFEAGICY